METVTGRRYSVGIPMGLFQRRTGTYLENFLGHVKNLGNLSITLMVSFYFGKPMPALENGDQSCRSIY